MNRRLQNGGRKGTVEVMAILARELHAFFSSAGERLVTLHTRLLRGQ